MCLFTLQNWILINDINITRNFQFENYNFEMVIELTHLGRHPMSPEPTLFICVTPCIHHGFVDSQCLSKTVSNYSVHVWTIAQRCPDWSQQRTSVRIRSRHHSSPHRGPARPGTWSHGHHIHCWSRRESYIGLLSVGQHYIHMRYRHQL